ncbi:GNAT family N-acetyltransferase [Methylobacterium sp. J-068]|uniref:GNAT family N-acetyltransferase n=1 Tax=Methylobacterium sp. J-068 TaxID=2836649 RepID=UPI001FBA119F|nr:GNAT family N-acetyltransferase [Methylobacterium sp. J-068]MCJ2036199.1 acetyltransferase [Methylobacterium sp. J-068]
MTVRNESRLAVREGEAERLVLRFAPDAGTLELATPLASAALAVPAFAAGLEAAFGWHPEHERLRVDLAGRAADPVVQALLREGLLLGEGGTLHALAAQAMQRPDPWLAARHAPFPQVPVLSHGRRHPRRPPKPQGTVYARYLPRLGRTFSLRAATLADDLDRLHRWMNDPRIAAFWGEEGDLDKHRRYLDDLIADPHMLPLVGSFDGEAFAYFEIYWAKENRLAPFYDAWDYDRGWHVLVGEERFSGRDYIGAWLPSLMHYLFLDDPRTQRIVGEPAASHVRQIRNLETSGFARLSTFDFPHKRAALVMLLRERFFGDRLWLPADLRMPAPE